MAYDVAAIRQLVAAAFSDEELQTFCFDNFPVVHQDFTAGQTQGQRVRLLVDFAARHGQLDALLDAIQKANPYQFDRFAADVRSASGPEAPSDDSWPEPGIKPEPFEPERIQTPAVAKIDTGGGAFVAGNINTGGGDVIGRDKITILVSIPDQADTLSKQLRQRAELLQPELKRKPFEPETILIPAGPFLMGSDEPAAREEERPQHKVTLPDFRIGKYPVTNDQYLAFVQQSRHPVAPEMAWRLAAVGQEPPPDSYQHPVVGVSWDDATAYCRWWRERTERRYRLPTEAAWERAARGTTGRRYPWGGDFAAERCNAAPAGLGMPSAVGTFSPQGDTPEGVADLAGNVWEWTSTCWGPDAAAPQYRYPYRSDDGRENPAAPEGPFREYRICRGGSFRDKPERVTGATRARFLADSRHPARGFRVAIEVGEIERE